MSRLRSSFVVTWKTALTDACSPPASAGGIARQLQEAPPKPGEIAARDPLSINPIIQQNCVQWGGAYPEARIPCRSRTCATVPGAAAVRSLATSMAARRSAPAGRYSARRPSAPAPPIPGRYSNRSPASCPASYASAQHVPPPAAAADVEPQPELRQLVLDHPLLDRHQVAPGLGPHRLLPPPVQLVELARDAVREAGLEGLGRAATLVRAVAGVELRALEQPGLGRERPLDQLVQVARPGHVRRQAEEHVPDLASSAAFSLHTRQSQNAPTAGMQSSIGPKRRRPVSTPKPSQACPFSSTSPSERP